MLDIQPAINKAGSDEEIFMIPGVYKRFRVDNENPPEDNIRIVGDQQSMPFVRRNPVGGSNTISLNTRQKVQLENMFIEIGDTAGLMAYTQIENELVGLKNVHFDGGWNADFNVGRKDAKWGVRSNEVVKWYADHCSANNIYREHSFYHQINGERKRVFITVDCVGKRTGRTFSQYVSYSNAPRPNEVEINLVRCIGIDNNLTTGGGGSTFTFRGGFPKAKVYMKDCISLQGCDPTLDPTPGRNITGSLVCDVGGYTWDPESYSCDEIVIDGGRFEVGQYYIGEGSARRPNFNIKKPRKLTIGKCTVIQHPGAHPNAMVIKSATAFGLPTGKYTFHAGATVIGRCTFDGVEYDTYEEMLSAISSIPWVSVITQI